MKKNKKTKRIELRVSENQFNRWLIKARVSNNGNLSEYLRDCAENTVIGRASSGKEINRKAKKPHELARDF